MTGVVVGGVDGGSLDNNAVLYIGGVPAPRLADSSGIIRSIVPVLFDSTTSWAATGRVLSVALVDGNGDTIGFTGSAFTLTDLPRAPGTTEAMLGDLQSMADAFHVWASAILPDPGMEQMIMAGALASLDSVLGGPSPLSLAVVLAEAKADVDTVPLALLDALLASSGAAEQAAGMASIIQDMAAGSPVSRLSGAVPASTELFDDELAYRMQAYVVIHEFGRTVVSPTAQQFSLAAAPVGIFSGTPYTAIVGAALSLIDFLTNKVIVAMLPAKIDEMKFEFVLDTILVGDTSNTIMRLEASNDPPPITVFDVISQIISGMGLAAASAEMDAMRAFLFDIVNYAATVTAAAYQAYAGAHPGLPLDPAITSIPDMSWNAKVSTPKFYELRTFTPNIVTPDAQELEWVSVVTGWGDARVYAVTTADNSAVVIPTSSQFQYSGGAFGNDIGKTETITISVQPKLVLQLDMPAGVKQGTFTPMTVKAGYEVPATTSPLRSAAASMADTIWSSNVQLALSVSGGNAQSTSGVTNASGEFVTGLALDAGSSQLTVTVDGNGDVGSSAQALGQATESPCAGSIEGPVGLTLGMGGGFFAIPTVLDELRIKADFGCVEVHLVAVNGTLNPTTVVTDGAGWAYSDLVMNEGVDSMIVYATAIGDLGPIEYDTAIIYSYCRLEGGCSYTEQGSGTYTATGSCYSADLSATAAPGQHSTAEVRFQDAISAIAADPNLYGEEAYAWYDVDVEWSVNGGSSGTIGVTAELATPYSGGEFLRVLNNGQADSGTFSTQIQIKISLAPWVQNGVSGRIRAGAHPTDTPENVAITSKIKMTVTRISRITLADMTTDVQTTCVEVASGIPYTGQ